MKFLNPVGLWLLLGLPALIIIYLIKARHEERPVSSTFLWKLSRKFMKRKLPIQRIKKILMFVLQFLMILALGLGAAKPALSLGPVTDYILILDASASMRTKTEEGISRFDAALLQVEEMVEQIEKGHTLTLILASDDAGYLIEETTSINEARLAISRAECGYGSCDTTDALLLAQMVCDRSEYAKVIFYTDNAYAPSDEIEIVDLGEETWNLTAQYLDLTESEEGFIFRGTMTSYGKDYDLAVGLKIDGKILSAKQIECKDGVPSSAVFEFTKEELPDFEKAEFYFDEPDAFQEDNLYGLCRTDVKQYRVMLVSPRPLYLRSALRALGNCEVLVSTTTENADSSGYDLYIYDGEIPEELPTDGSVLIFDSDRLPFGLILDDKIKESSSLELSKETESDLYKALSLQESSAAKFLLKDVQISSYTPLKGDADWETIFTCDDYPVWVRRDLGEGRSCSVVGFDLHDTNLPMMADFAVLMRNVLLDSAPALIKDQTVSVGDAVHITLLAGAKTLRMKLPDESLRGFSVEQEKQVFTPKSPGVYSLVMTTETEGETKRDGFFAGIPDSESLRQELEELHLLLPAEHSGLPQASSEIWTFVAGVLLVLLLAEWGLHCHEQY